MLVLKLMLCLLLVGQCVCDDCPDECLCKDRRVTCDDVDMKEIPDDIPTDTTSLIIMGTPTAQFSISRIAAYKLKYLQQLTELYVVFAGVTNVDVDAFQNLKQLKLLDLKHNHIKNIYQDTFKGLINLELINLSGNEYLDLQTGTVANLPSLRDLYLSDLQLRSLHPSSFIGLDSLMHLDLSGNNLRRLDKSIFVPLTNLASLDLSGNRFKSLNDEMGSTLQKFESLALGDNPWQCNCKMQWLKQLPMKFIYDTTDFSADRVVVCEGPEELKFKNLKDVPDDQLKCIVPEIKDCLDVSDIKGNSVRIICDISGEPFPDITWTSPDKSVIKSVDELDANKFEYSENGTLLIKSLNLSQNGTWHVMVDNGKGQDETIFNIDVGIPPSVKCQDVVAKEGDELLIKCYIEGSPLPNIHWILPDKSVVASEKGVDVSKYELRKNQQLIVKSLNVADGGKWTVIASSKNGNASATFKVEVQESGFKPTIKNCKDVVAKEGEELLIQCDIEGSPLPNIHWILPDKSVVASEKGVDVSKYELKKNQQLIVKSLNVADGGKWTVIASNIKGNASETFKVEVQASGFKPTIKNCKDVNEEKGKKIMIDCEIEGDPFPNITWTLPDHSQISSTDDVLPDNLRVMDRKLLVIKSLQDKYTGEWKVEAKNRLGIQSAFVDVSVKKTDWIIIGAACGGGVALLSLIIITVVCCKNKENKVGDTEKG